MIATVCSVKGGAGKTTVATLLATYTADNDYKTLLVDLSPQPDATGSCLDRSRLNYVYQNSRASQALFQMDRSLNFERDAVRAMASIFGRLYIYPSTVFLEDFVPNQKEATRAIERFIVGAQEIYEHVIIDTPAGASSINKAAILASDVALIPNIPTSLGLFGTQRTIEFASRLIGSQAGKSPKLAVIQNMLQYKDSNDGFLTGYELEQYCKQVNVKIFEACLREREVYRRSQRQGILLRSLFFKGVSGLTDAHNDGMALAAETQNFGANGLNRPIEFIADDLLDSQAWFDE